MAETTTYDLVVIGGGINGCGIAADAAGRGLKVLLVEAEDLGCGTSSASSKLIHGGLRYLEHYEFRLVREALAEREVLLAKAPHIIWPLRFVLPHVPGLRPRWMIRAGLVLYDHLARRQRIPGSTGLDLRQDAAGRPLRDDLNHGFAYWDCWVDDARLVVLNARAAADRGADIRTRTRATRIEPHGHHWHVHLTRGNAVTEIRARALVNAAGPWVDQVAACVAASGANARPQLRLIKGSHIVVPRIAGADDAYLLQSADGRVVFALPYEDHFTLIGTTDLPFTGDARDAAISVDEESYLLALASRFFKTPLTADSIVWRYSGVRPLYDDQSDNPSAVTRDYKLDVSAGHGLPPMLTVMGGKITTYRRLAEEALARLAPHMAPMGPAWTRGATLPGGSIANADFAGFTLSLCRQYPNLDPVLLRRLARRHGSNTALVLGTAKLATDLGRDLGYGLTEREVDYLGHHEWAMTADDVLWRRTKVGLHLTPAERVAAELAINRRLRVG